MCSPASPCIGGDDPEDDSGVLQYVRVWYGGGVVSNDSEINGITFYAVGNGTTVDHIEGTGHTMSI